MKNIIGKGVNIPDTKRIVFLGDSITENGTYIAQMNSYFLQHMTDKKIELINLGLSSETVSGLSEQDHPFPRPCVLERADRVLEISKPEWVVVCYGMNDGIYHPFSEERFSAYKNGMLELVSKIKSFGAKAIIVTPPPFDAGSVNSNALQPEGMDDYSFTQPYKDYSKVLRQYGTWITSELVDTVDMVIDIYSPISYYIDELRKQNSDYTYGDGVHPNIDGHWVIAKTLLRELFNICLERDPLSIIKRHNSEMFDLIMEKHWKIASAWKEYVGYALPNNTSASATEAQCAIEVLGSELKDVLQSKVGTNGEEITDWKGYKRHDFYVDGREGILIEPKNTAPGNPWIWRTEFFDAFSYADMAMLEKGSSLAYYRMSNLYGCPEAISRMHKFYEFIIKTYKLMEKVVLFGFSRGGLYAFNYAAEYPQNVSGIYLDAPVLDLKSWPGGKGQGVGAPSEWAECLNVYGLYENSIQTYKGMPLDKVEAVVKASIPVIIVAGDSDEVVPFVENGANLVERFNRLGGKIKLILKPGVGHHPHSLENPKEIVDFIEEHCLKV